MKGDAKPAFDQHLVVRVPRQQLAIGGVALAAVAGLLMIAFGSYLMASRAQLLFILAAFLPTIVNRWPLVKIARIRAARDGFHLLGKFYPRESIRSAVVRHEDGKTYARLELTWARRVDVQVESDEAAGELFAALGLDAMSSTVQFPMFTTGKLPNVIAAIPFVIVALLMPALHAVTTFAPFLFFLLIPFVLVLWNRARSAKMRVGADGIGLEGGLAKAVFYKHSEIERVDNEGVRVDVTLKNGDVKSYNAALTKNPKEAHIEVARSIVRRIYEAREANEKLDAVASDALVLARGSREKTEWIAWLKRLGEGADAGFREVATSRDALLRIVESTRASAVERLAAAIALRSKLTEDEKPRLRIALERCAEPELRDRLRVVIDEPDAEASEKALFEAETEEAERESGARRHAAAEK